MNIHLWAIIGGKGQRKGSTIRALTGIGSAHEFELMLENGQRLPMQTQISSVSEPKDAPGAKDWIKSLQSLLGPRPHARLNLLHAFRTDMAPPPAAQSYLEAFAAAGGTIDEPIPEWVRPLGVSYISVSDITVPTNQIASLVRRAWGWR